MKYGYLKLIEEKKLKVSELPEEVQIAIDYLTTAEKGINLAKSRLEKEGKPFKQSEKITKKIKQLDAWAVRGINEHLAGEVVEGAAPVTDTTILTMVADENKTPAPAVEPAIPPVVVAPKTEPVVVEPAIVDSHEIDIELLSLHKDKVEVMTLDEVKSKAPKSYKIIFEHYEEGKENGLETSHFSLMETENNNFKLAKI